MFWCIHIPEIYVQVAIYAGAPIVYSSLEMYAKVVAFVILVPFLAENK